MTNARRNAITGLTDKQESFLLAYMECGDSHRAYREAYNAKNMSDGCIRGEVSKLLRHQAITKQLGVLKTERAKNIAVDASWLLNSAIENYHLALEQGELGHANKALEIIGKHVNIQAFKETKEVNVNLNIAERLERARARAIKARTADMIEGEIIKTP